MGQIEKQLSMAVQYHAIDMVLLDFFLFALFALEKILNTGMYWVSLSVWHAQCTTCTFILKLRIAFEAMHTAYPNSY